MNSGTCMECGLLSTVQGQSVSSNGVLKPYTIKRKPGTEYKPWQTTIVMSDAPKDQLPPNMKQGGARRLCDVMSALKDKEVFLFLPSYEHGQSD